MPPDEGWPEWSLGGFEEAFGRWVELERPDIDLRMAVAAWFFSRYDDPYQGMRRERGFRDLWYGEVPDSEHGTGQVVVCTLWINESDRTVRCDMLASLDPPIASSLDGPYQPDE